MRNEVSDMLDALQDYYEATYNDRMRKDIVADLRNLPKKYLLELYKQVTYAHPSRFGKLPDLAVIGKVRDGMGPSETYRDAMVALEGPVAVITEAQIRAQERKMTGGVANWEEVNRVGARIARGDGTRYEKHWYWCMTENGGVWAKPKEEDL